jgi:hypothetical protein
MEDRTLMNAIKDLLNTSLTDPRTQWGGASRNFVHTDRPLVNAAFPRIQINKRPRSDRIISLSYNFWEWRTIVLDIYFWTKSDFKWNVGTSTVTNYLSNEELAKEYNEKIWKVIKDNAQTLHDTYGITGFKIVEDDTPEPDEDEQFYRSRISLRFWYFEKEIQ